MRGGRLSSAVVVAVVALFLICLICLVLGGGGRVAFALSLDQLDPQREWRVESITLSGNTFFDDKTLLAEMPGGVRVMRITPSP